MNWARLEEAPKSIQNDRIVETWVNRDVNDKAVFRLSHAGKEKWKPAGNAGNISYDIPLPL